MYQDMDQLGTGIMDEEKIIAMAYEDFFKLMNQKNKEVEELQMSNTQLSRMVLGSEKSVMLALFSD